MSVVCTGGILRDFSSSQSLRLSRTASQQLELLQNGSKLAAVPPVLPVFAFPFGAPLPAAPPCIRQRFLRLTTGDRHGNPLRARAPHRLASRKAGGSRVVRCMGLILISVYPPPCLMCHRPDNRLPAGMHMNVLDAHRLFAATSELGEGLSPRATATCHPHRATSAIGRRADNICSL